MVALNNIYSLTNQVFILTIIFLLEKWFSIFFFLTADSFQMKSYAEADYIKWTKARLFFFYTGSGNLKLCLSRTVKIHWCRRFENLILWGYVLGIVLERGGTRKFYFGNIWEMKLH